MYTDRGGIVMSIKYDVFISYRRDKGGDLARYFQSELNRKNYKCFIDVEELNAGHFPSKLYECISNSDLVLLLLSEGSIDRLLNKDDYVRQELIAALENNKTLFIVSKEPDIYNKLGEYQDEIVNYIKQMNILIYTHEGCSTIVQKIYAALEEMKRVKFDFDDLLKGEENNRSLKGNVGGIQYVYNGEVRRNRPYDEGILLDRINNRKYEGIWYGWETPELSGRGRVYEQEKLIYEGGWSKLKFHGEGILYEEDGVYEGTFVNGLKHGIGKKKFSSGRYYMGGWIEGYQSGYGECIYEDGKHYIGQFYKNTINGLGKTIYPDGSKYDGEYENSISHGYGIKIFSNGYSYKGLFYEGLFHTRDDQESELYKDGQLIYKGGFYKGTFDEFGEFYYSNGLVYKGLWNSGQKSKVEDRGSFFRNDEKIPGAYWNIDEIEVLNFFSINELEDIINEEYHAQSSFIPINNIQYKEVDEVKQKQLIQLNMFKPLETENHMHLDRNNEEMVEISIEDIDWDDLVLNLFQD